MPHTASVNAAAVASAYRHRPVVARVPDARPPLSLSLGERGEQALFHRGGRLPFLRLGGQRLQRCREVLLTCVLRSAGGHVSMWRRTLSREPRALPLPWPCRG